MSRNAEMAALLEETADLLDAKDVDYKPRAYRRAAESIRDHPQAIEDLAEDGKSAVKEVDHVGDSIAEKIIEYFETGSIDELDDLHEEYPVEMDALTNIEGVGPKTVGTLYEALGIQNLADMEEAASEGKIREVGGFGEKTEQNILDSLEFAQQAQKRELLGDAKPLSEDVYDYFDGVEAVAEHDIAGSIRRWRPTIGDVDLVTASDEPESVIEALTDWEQADEVIEAGTTKASVRSSGIRIDLRVVEPDEFGSALQYFTGSADHNIALRNRAIDRDLKMNEYGVFDVSERSSDGTSDSAESDDISTVEDEDAGQKVGDRVAGDTEESMYEAIDLPWIPPELREDRGEVEAAANGKLPDLVAEDDIRGDLQTHTEWSDGDNTVEEMVEGATEFGYDYLAITDHATGPGMVGGVGLSDEEFHEQRAEIREVAEDADIEVFAGAEANIDDEGGISIGDDVLDELDIVVAAPHSGLDGDGTDRLVTAIEHPEVDVIGHPTGRYINRRKGMDVDVETVAKAAAEEDVALEVDGDPARLDLEGSQVQVAVEQGATIAIDTDAHRVGSLDYVRYGVHTARRGWAETGDVLNARDADGVRDFLGL